MFIHLSSLTEVCPVRRAHCLGMLLWRPGQSRLVICSIHILKAGVNFSILRKTKKKFASGIGAFLWIESVLDIGNKINHLFPKQFSNEQVPKIFDIFCHHMFVWYISYSRNLPNSILVTFQIQQQLWLEINIWKRCASQCTLQPLSSISQHHKQT